MEKLTPLNAQHRALKAQMVHFHGWIARRYEDPAFKAAFPEFGTEKYWNQEIKDLYEQEQAIASFSWY